jgi:hypothetical protein
VREPEINYIEKTLEKLTEYQDHSLLDEIDKALGEVKPTTMTEEDKRVELAIQKVKEDYRLSKKDFKAEKFLDELIEMQGNLPNEGNFQEIIKNSVLEWQVSQGCFNHSGPTQVNQHDSMMGESIGDTHLSDKNL